MDTSIDTIDANTASPSECETGQDRRFNADQIYKFLSVMSVILVLYAGTIMAVIMA